MHIPLSYTLEFFQELLQTEAINKGVSNGIINLLVYRNLEENLPLPKRSVSFYFDITEIDDILRKNFYSFDIELFYISETNELKVLDFGKRTIKPPSLAKFKLTSAITDRLTFFVTPDTQTLKEYLSIKEQEKRFDFIFDKIKQEAIKTLEFWTLIELESSARFFSVLCNKFPIEFISDKELESIFLNYKESDPSQFDFLLFQYQVQVLSLLK